MKKKGDTHYPLKVRTAAVSKYLACASIIEVSQEMGIPYHSVQYWVAQARRKNPEKFEQMRQRINAEFELRANHIIDKTMLLLDRKVTTALEDHAAIESIISEIENDDISKERKKKLISEISKLSIDKAGELTTIIGVMRDKRALAAGESTQNTRVDFKLPDEVREYAD